MAASYAYNLPRGAAALAQSSSNPSRGGFQFDDTVNALGAIGTGTKAAESTGAQRFASDIWGSDGIAGLYASNNASMGRMYETAFGGQSAVTQQGLMADAARDARKPTAAGIFGSIAGLGLGAFELFSNPIGTAAGAATGFTKNSGKSMLG
jgi:hypothetical protein